MATVLVVDDSAFMRMRCVSSVKDLGHETMEAGDGVLAVEAYKQQKPDAVLLDITMPNMDGLAALKEILAFDSDARVAMVTAMGQQSMVMEAAEHRPRSLQEPTDAPPRRALRRPARDCGRISILQAA